MAQSPRFQAGMDSMSKEGTPCHGKARRFFVPRMDSTQMAVCPYFPGHYIPAHDGVPEDINVAVINSLAVNGLFSLLLDRLPTQVDLRTPLFSLPADSSRLPRSDDLICQLCCQFLDSWLLGACVALSLLFPTSQSSRDQLPSAIRVQFTSS